VFLRFCCLRDSVVQKQQAICWAATGCNPTQWILLFQTTIFWSVQFQYDIENFGKRQKSQNIVVCVLWWCRSFLLDVIQTKINTMKKTHCTLYRVFDYVYINPINLSIRFLFFVSVVPPNTPQWNRNNLQYFCGIQCRIPCDVCFWA